MDTGEVASAATVTDKASPSSPVPVLPTRSAKSVYRPKHTDEREHDDRGDQHAHRTDRNRPQRTKQRRDRDDDVWMPNDPTITMPAAAITRPRAERGARSLPNTPPLSRPFPHDLCVTNDSVRRRLATCGVDFVWRDQRKAQAHSRNGIR